MAKSLRQAVKIIGAAVSIGQPKKGVEKTPDILKSHNIERLFSKNYEPKWAEIVHQPKDIILQKERTKPVKNLEELGEYGKKLYDSILRHKEQDDFLLTVGGDHSIGSTTISALLNHYSSNLSVIWIDAHGDCNTPTTSPSGNYHGMPVAHILGLFKPNSTWAWMRDFLPVNRMAQIGIRELDETEQKLVHDIGLKYYTPQDIQAKGMERVIEEALDYIDPDKTRHIHLSADVDGMDPALCPGTGTVSDNGLTLEDYRTIIQALKKRKFSSIDLVEINFEIEREITIRNVEEIIRLSFE